jgi:hypothetical protein
MAADALAAACFLRLAATAFAAYCDRYASVFWKTVRSPGNPSASAASSMYTAIRETSPSRPSS